VTDARLDRTDEPAISEPAIGEPAIGEPASDGPPGALAGIRVVDLTTVLMGPLATRMLADHGADVIRVEAKGGEAFLDSEPRRHPHMNAMALNAHRNKRSVALDLKNEEGAAAMVDLVATADVLVSNMRAGALERLGLDAATLRARHPGLVHCVANGYGSAGPYADRAAYDDAIQAISGLAALQTRVTGEPGYSPAVMADKVCSLHIVQAIMAALLHKARTGLGQAIEVPMFETMVAFNLVEHHGGHLFDPPLGDVGYPRTLSPFRKPYRCADGYACILPYNDANWRAFFDFVGRPEVMDDPRFAAHADRIANSSELYGMVEELAPTRTVAQWMEFCVAYSIPANPVLDLNQMADDPHLQAVGMMPVLDHPTEGRYRAVRDAITYEATPTRLRRHAPTPGQHTAEILTELGWSAERMNRMA
jgi:crotonobetainyl-CoA:carnitine CoA-transferase CaiB-like acyl-CoA transferase